MVLRRTPALLLAVLLALALVSCSGGDALQTSAPSTNAPRVTDAAAVGTPVPATDPGTAPPGTAPPGTVPPGTEPGTSVPPETPRTTAAVPVTTARPRPAPPTTVATVPPPPPPTTAPAPATPPLPPGPNSVFVEGDSVLLGTTTTLPAALAGWVVTMDCVGSRRLTQAIPVLQARRAEIGRVLVIQMGNNYIPGEGGSFASQIDQVMAIVAGVDRVVWVTVAEVNGPSRVEINNDIRAAATRYPTIVVAEWAPLVAAHPEYAPGDALHLSASGRVAMADLVAAAVGPAP